MMQRKGAWLKPKKGGKSLRAGPVNKVKEEKKTRKTIGKRKKVGVEAVSQEERVDIAATKEDPGVSKQYVLSTALNAVLTCFRGRPSMPPT